jgi:hypothetical protein
LPEGVEGVLVGVVALHFGDAAGFHADELAARHVESPAFVVGGRVLDRDDVIGTGGDVDQSGAQRAAGERAGAGEEVVVDRLPTVMVTAECSPARQMPDRVGGEAGFHRGKIPGHERGVEPPDSRDIVLADSHPAERKSRRGQRC